MRTYLDELPTEIIHSILDYVLDSSQHTARALSRTNKCLFEAVNIIRSRRKTIVLDKDGKILGLAKSNPSIFDNTHHLTIEASKDSRVPFSDTDTLVELIDKVKNLKTLIWNVGPIPVDILSVLRKSHPTCTLRIFKWWRFDHMLNHLDQSELVLSKFENLTHLRYVVSNDGFGTIAATPYAWEVFREIVAMSQSLKLASFLIGFMSKDPEDQDWEGVVLDHSGQIKSKFQTLHSKGLPLKSLTIDCPDFRISSATLHQIGSFTNLSALEYLKVSRGRTQIDYFQTAPALLSNLKHISLNFNGLSSESLSSAKQYLLACHPAKTISLWGWSSVIGLSELLAHHGQCIETLQLHEKEDPWSNSPGYVIGLTDIKLIDRSCPQLVDLTLDLDVKVNSDVPTSSFAIDAEIAEALRMIADVRPQFRRFHVYHQSGELWRILQDVAAENAKTLPAEPIAENSDEDAEEEHEHIENQEVTDLTSIFKEMRKNELRSIESRRNHVLSLVEPYVSGLWKSLFGTSAVGEKLLDVKFGDWEHRSLVRGIGYEEARTLCEVRPHERDDRFGQCVVKTRLWSNFEPKGL